MTRSGVARTIAVPLLIIGILIGGFGYYLVSSEQSGSGSSSQVPTTSQTTQGLASTSTPISVSSSSIPAVTITVTETSVSTTVLSSTVKSAPASTSAASLAGNTNGAPLFVIVSQSQYLAYGSTCAGNGYTNLVTPFEVRLLIQNQDPSPIAAIAVSVGGDAAQSYTFPPINQTARLYQFETAAVGAVVSPPSNGADCVKPAVTVYATDINGDTSEQTVWIQV